MNSYKFQNNINVASYIKQWRANEDRYSVAMIGDIVYLAVFDGHGGAAGSPDLTHKDHPIIYLENNLHVLLEKKFKEINTEDDAEICRAITDVCIDVDREFFESGAGNLCGSCATIVLITNKKIVQANIGDCRSIIFDDDGIISETEDCTPEREYSRINAAGGAVVNCGCFRVNSILAVSRAFGDNQLKKIMGIYSPHGPVSVIPEIIITPRSQGQHIVMGSDGLLDGFFKSSAQLVFEIKNQLKLSNSLGDICNKLSHKASARTTDDITMVLVSL